MSGHGTRSAMNEYRQIALPSRLEGATPHELVQLMLDGAVARVVAARGALAAGRAAQKCELIGKAIGLVEGLRASLDRERGGELASNLDALYDYMTRRLLEANLRSDGDILLEVGSLLRELQTGWRELGELIAGRGAWAAPASGGAS